MFDRYYNAIYCLTTVTLGLLTASIYTTSIIEIAKEFAVTDNDIQMGVFIYLLGSALTAPFYGAFSDQYGRRHILFMGNVMYVIASLMLAFSQDLNMFLLGRFIQGVGAGAFSVVAIASIQDIRTPAEGAKVMGWVSVFAGPAPLIGPIIGSVLSDAFGWRAIFAFCFVIGLVLTIGLLFLLETAPRVPRNPTEKHKRLQRAISHIVRILQNYGRMLTNKQFMLYAAQSPFITCGFWCAITAYPVYFMRVLGVAKHEYSMYSQYVALAYAIGLYFLSKSVDRFGLEKTLKIGLKVGMTIGILHLIGPGFLRLPLGPSFLFLSVYMICMSLTFSPSVSRSMQIFEQDKGCAAAISNSLRKLASALGAYLAGIFEENTLIPVSLTLFFATAIPYGLLKLRRQTV